MSHDSSQFLFINLTKKKRECDRKLKWTNFIKIIERKILYKKESERKIFQKKNFEEEIFSKKRKTKVIKKFEKFYNKYLGIMLEIKNNTMIWKFLKQFASNAKPSHYLILSKNSRLYNVNIKISGKTTNLVYVKKEIKQKNSLSRSIMLIRKQILNKNIFFLRL